MAATQRGPILVFVVKVVVTEQWLESELAQILSLNMVAEIARFLVHRKKLKVVIYFHVLSMVIFPLGHSSVFAVKVAEMVPDQELEIVQILFQNMVVKIVLY